LDRSESRQRRIGRALALSLALAGAPLAAQEDSSARPGGTPAEATRPEAGIGIPPLDLAGLERRALAESPQLRAARERLAAAEERLAGRGRFSDPMLELELMDVLPTGGRPLEVRPMVRQSLPAPGKRAAERAIAAAEIEVARAGLLVAERELLAELRAAWAEHWVAERERALLAEEHEIAQLLQEVADARLAGGRGTLAEALAARRATRRHELMQEDADARFLAAISRLAELAGSESPPAIAHGEPLGLPSAAPLPDLDVAATAAADPRVALAERRVELAAERLAALRLERRPDWSIAAGTRTMEGDSTELIVGVGVELPLFRRRRLEPEIAGAERELAAARADADSARLAGRGALERLYVERFRLEARARRLEQGLLPEIVAAFEVERAALAGGEGAIAPAAMLLEELIAARLELERTRAALFGVRAAFLSYLPDDPAGGDE
jgi:outer membrane protein, heavy metal efflux system